MDGLGFEAPTVLGEATQAGLERRGSQSLDDRPMQVRGVRDDDWSRASVDETEQDQHEDASPCVYRERARPRPPAPAPGGLLGQAPITQQPEALLRHRAGGGRVPKNTPRSSSGVEAAGTLDRVDRPVGTGGRLKVHQRRPKRQDGAS